MGVFDAHVKSIVHAHAGSLVNAHAGSSIHAWDGSTVHAWATQAEMTTEPFAERQGSRACIWSITTGNVTIALS